jgi:hypothetical protein
VLAANRRLGVSEWCRRGGPGSESSRVSSYGHLCSTPSGLEECGEFVGIDLQQAGADSDSVQVPCGDPSPDCAVRDVAIVRGLLKADQFRVSPFPTITGGTCRVCGHGETAFAVPLPTDYSVSAFHAPAFTYADIRLHGRTVQRAPEPFGRVVVWQLDLFRLPRRRAVDVSRQPPAGDPVPYVVALEVHAEVWIFARKVE